MLSQFFHITLWVKSPFGNFSHATVPLFKKPLNMTTVAQNTCRVKKIFYQVYLHEWIFFLLLLDFPYEHSERLPTIFFMTC